MLDSLRPLRSAFRLVHESTVAVGRRRVRPVRLALAGSSVLIGLLLGACQPAPKPAAVLGAPDRRERGLLPGGLDETPAPAGDWRPHWLARCRERERLPAAVEACLSDARELFAAREGAEAIAMLEICREEHGSGGMLDLTLAQLYLLAGQGEPELLPREGPAADVGNWPRNKARLLARASALLGSAAHYRPDDAVVDFLRADVARARGRAAKADSIVWGALAKCSRQSSVELLRRYQQLNRYPAKLMGSVSPTYPREALDRGVQGKVVLDLLIDPAGQVMQAVAVESPDWSLARAAALALSAARIEPARVGKYPIWSWLRVTTSFTLE